MSMQDGLVMEDRTAALRNASEILVVEDSLTQAKRLERLLKEHGYGVRIARNGFQGLAFAREKKPTVVITDVMMPEMDGYELCRRIKGDETLRDVPVVLLTSLSDPRDVIRGLQCGADNFLTKPYEDAHLLRRLHHILVNLELRREGHAQMTVEVFFAGQHHRLTADRIQIIDLLLSTFEAAVLQSTQLQKLNGDYRHALEEIKQAQANFRTLMETTGDAVLVVDAQGTVRYVNPAAELLFDVRAEELTGTPFLFPLEEEGKREINITSPNGDILVGDMRVVNSSWDGEVVRLVTIRDITEMVLLRERLKEEAITDPLTGLYNRRGFLMLGEERLALADRLGFSVVCLFADLDGFKAVNDTFGHEEGDRVLRETADVLRRTFRAADVLGRIGGDEFAVLLVQDGPEGIGAVMARLRHTLEQANVRNENPSVRLSLSLGVSMRLPETPCTLSELMDEADQSMYKEKIAKRKLRSET
ncbi:diguanylate cyclase [Aminiphilus circumscriptus]|uniref:diguanylate cyclase n=1 Tax=Aminiphilus circumscriptus TaxID=290732 RepID=UPI00055610EB|nr:diguanylate cyclase [Aminiphilus circumscriptus]